MSERRLRVLLLVDAGTFHAERFAVELRRQGCRVLTVSMEKGQTLHVRLKRIGPFRRLHYFLAGPQVRRIISRFQPDIVNPHFASGYGYMAARAARGQVPIVLNLWGSDILIVPHKSKLHRRKTRRALLRANHVVGDSEYLVEAATNFAPIRWKSVIPWGIERAYLDYHKTDYILPRPLNIIVPRAHDTVYNNLFIVEALADLINSEKVVITFPGFGRLRDQFKSDSAKLVGDRIRYYDKLPRPEFMKLMARHDLYLSAASSDSSPVTLIEAMALGLIPVAAEIEGVKEWLSPQTGFLYQPGDHDGLKNLLSGIIERNDSLKQMRASNLERVKSEAIFEENVAEEIAIMKSLAWKEYA